VQDDIKKLVAYSSVSHLGFCVLGLVALNSTGSSGSVLYMINHGLSTGALFLLIGMIYERYHTRDMRRARRPRGAMPVWAFFMVFFAMASVGLPGLNGFVSEFMPDRRLPGRRAGTGRRPGHPALGPWYAAVAGTGMSSPRPCTCSIMVGQGSVFGPLVEPEGHHHHEPLPARPLLREIGTLTLPSRPGASSSASSPPAARRPIHDPVNQTVDRARPQRFRPCRGVTVTPQDQRR
jgi:NADH-quinone oxidoreductase subunit M